VRRKDKQEQKTEQFLIDIFKKKNTNDRMFLIDYYKNLLTDGDLGDVG
jgi:hypothetical protein